MRHAVIAFLTRSLLMLGSALCLGLPLAQAAEDLPDIGSSIDQQMPLSKEQALGEAIMRQVRQQMPLNDDPEVFDYINQLGFRLVAHNHNGKSHGFYFFVVKDPTINAFALPGGFIGVNSGLISGTERESELAAVLGHEIAHVTQRHIARRIEAQSNLSMPMLAGLLIGVAAIAAGAPDAGMAAVYGSQAGAMQTAINYTRSNEAEADRVGIETLAAAGYDSGAVASMFHKMQEASKYSRRPPEFLLTHPVTERRIAEGRQRAAQFKAGRDQDPLGYALIKARIAHLEHPDPDNLLKSYERQASGKLASPENRYGRALALTRLTRYAEARPLLEGLLNADPGRLAYVLAMARLDSAERRFEPARALLSKHLKINPGNHPLTVAKAQLLLAMDKAGEARDLLREHLYGHENEVSLYALLAEAEGKAGDLDQVFETQAEQYFLQGDIQRAIRQLRQALRQRSDDPYARTRIKARLAQMDELYQKDFERR